MKSDHYRIWQSVRDFCRCWDCKRLQGTLFPIGVFNPIEPPLHLNCRCWLERAETKYAGTATKNGVQGADWWLISYGKLPPYYINEEDALNVGWKPWLGNLGKVAPGKMLGDKVFLNRNYQLPTVAGRIWYEADINYTGGFRKAERILYSNDGLIFATYDHYKTFVEII